VVVSRGQGEIARLHREVKALQLKGCEHGVATRRMEKRKEEGRKARAEMDGWRKRVGEKVEEVEAWIREGCSLDEMGGEGNLDAMMGMGGMDDGVSVGTRGSMEGSMVSRGGRSGGTGRTGEEEVRPSEERSDKLARRSLVTKTAGVRTFIQDTPPP